MAITRQPGKIACSVCGSEVPVYWLQAINMPRQPEALPEGWAYRDGNATCDCRDVEPDPEWSSSVQEWPEPRLDAEPQNNGD